MIINKVNPINEMYVYKISDVEGGALALLLKIQNILSNIPYSIIVTGAVEKVINKGVGLFLQECQNRIWYFESQDVSDLNSALAERLVPDCLDFIEKYSKYLDLLSQEENNLLDKVKSSTKYKQANADTPITKKFDESYTIDDYISWLTINQSETSNDLGTIAQRLQEISDLYKGYSNELKNILECNVLIYNSGIESEMI